MTLSNQADASGASTTLNASSQVWKISTNNSGSLISCSGRPLTINTQGGLVSQTSTFNFVCASGSATIDAASYYNLGFGVTLDSFSAATYTLSGSTTVQNTLTIGNSGSTNVDTLSDGGYDLTLSGSSTPFNITTKGLFTGTGTTTYSGTAATNVAGATYKNLGLGTTSDSNAVTYTLLGNATSSTITIGNSGSSVNDTFDIGSNTLNISGTGTPVSITSKGIFSAGAASTINFVDTTGGIRQPWSWHNCGRKYSRHIYFKRRHYGCRNHNTR